MRVCVFLVERSGDAQPPYRGGATALLAALSCAFFLAGAPASYALDSSNANNAPQKISPESFTSAEEALRAGVDDLHHGDAQELLRALTYAAEGGQLLARWKLGNLYSTGDLVPRNDVLAYKYFEQLVESYSEDEVDRRDLGAISNAFVAVGLYNLSGIPGSDIKPDPERALEMFQVAATDFGDPEAQYQLGRMYLEGAAGLVKDNMRAARWLALAAEKGHCGAQALLGHLLFNGEGVPRQRARGLMWLSVAVNGAKGAEGCVDPRAADQGLQRRQRGRSRGRDHLSELPRKRRRADAAQRDARRQAADASAGRRADGGLRAAVEQLAGLFGAVTLPAAGSPSRARGTRCLPSAL